MAIAAPSSPVARIARLLGATPDALTGLACVLTWMFPFALGQGAVKTIVLMMLMEFLLVHGTGFFTGIVFADEMAKARRLLLMSGLLCFYGLFVAAFCFSFKAWWPVWMFLWLVLSKAAWVFLSSRDRAQEAQRQLQAWAFSTAAYIGAVFAGLLLPLPRLGLTEAVVPQLGLPGSGEWIERPQTAVAGMAFYFFALAAFKAFLARRRG